MDILKCTSYKIYTLFFLLIIFTACSQERQLKNEIYIYHWNNKDHIKAISLTEIKDGRKIKIYNKNIEIKKKYDSLNKAPYVLLIFKDAKQLQINKSYELKINNSIYKINDFKVASKNKGSDIFYSINGEPNEIGDDNIIKMDLEK